MAIEQSGVGVLWRGKLTVTRDTRLYDQLRGPVTLTLVQAHKPVSVDL